MKILQFRPSRIKNRINITFDDGSYLPFFIDDIFILKLSRDQEIDKAKYEEIKAKSDYYLAYNYTLRQIAVSPKTEILLRQKLHHKYPHFNPDQVIDIIKSKNLLNSDDYLEYFLKRHPLKSNRELQFLLSRQGIKYQSSQNDREKIKNLLKKKKNLTISALARRGFAYGDIKSVFDERDKSGYNKPSN